VALDAFCRKHAQRSPAARCTGCHAHLCKDCIMRFDGEIFCSGRCQENFKKFAARKPFGGTGPSLVESLRNVLLPLGIVLGASYYLAHYQGIGWAQWLMGKLGLWH